MPTRSAGPVERMLRTPLLTKLVLVDLAVNVLAFAILQVVPPDSVTEVTFVSLAGIAVLNALVVAWALRPLAALEDTARRVSAGEFTARTELPAFTDRNLARIGSAFDALLDRVEADRSRLRTLASEVVAAGDRERAHIARELHDGTAQSLSALDMLLATAVQQAPSEAPRLQVMRDVVTEALGEVRSLAQNVHPRVLDDLGIHDALTHLARRTRETGGPEVMVECPQSIALSPAVSSVLYRVAQEAVHNATKHAATTSVHVTVRVDGDRVRLEVTDRGVGFSRGADSGHGMGLFVMEERVGLVDGTFEVRSTPGIGTTVTASVPIGADPPAAPLLAADGGAE